MWKSNNQRVKEETFIQMDRRGRDLQLAWRGLSARWRLVDQVVPHLCAVPEGTTGEQDRPCKPGFQCRENKASKPLTVKTCRGCGSGRNSQPHRRVHWRDQQGPRMYTNPPTWESAPEGPNLLVGSRGSD